MASRRSRWPVLVRVLIAAPAAALAAINGYLAILTALAARRARRRGPVSDRALPRTSFAILIPAHNEEAVIARTLQSTARQTYPPDLVSVHVVADNCTDATAAIARGLGATVHERADLVRPGKGPALGWLVERISTGGALPDAMVIVDADTVLDPGFLAAADGALADGHQVVQGFYSVSDPDASTAVAIRFIALALRHYVRPLGRMELGGSCGLFGNGMIFRSNVLQDRRFSDHLTEDAEMQLDLLLDGKLVRFAPEAVLHAEMPQSTEAATSQNERWELGRVQLARRYVPPLLAKAVQPGQRARVAYADACLDAVVPPLSVVAVVTGGAVATTWSMRALLPGRLGPGASRLSLLAALALGCHVAGGMRIARVPADIAKALVAAPRYALWKAGLWARVVIRPGAVTWSRTRRNVETSGGQVAS